MTHKPRVPAASQSPYPLHPAPVEPGTSPATDRPFETEPAPQPVPHSSGWTIGIGLVVAAFAYLLFRRR
ncbi:hypothetical protein BV98_001638 [Sphingobium herbicidovorans NBRC 16415]|uniref:Uncharacterized protein n=1 Tax=Sphingobium herbicidovorans (strain ATCC 700291 / DSM 11019 / CCUG 56400 / KCTC 2939 / LMG 18315 / NBRC 16415 / MH) TaxID=1219045 RepID=A0A086PAL6_SPHHM|nr:hypothetical protein [Sphingobium herbicidovorans]KFG90434.1 hypothetical protein BV98_001638 [Sphingobium herbicidovorans NBRC 16415]